MTLLIELVVDLGENWTEFLQRLPASKPLHGPANRTATAPRSARSFRRTVAAAAIDRLEC
jgi:hypothetical protein